MKRKIKSYLILIFLIVIFIVGYFLFTGQITLGNISLSNKTMTELDTKYERPNYIPNEEYKIEDTSNIKGKSIAEGGPYKIGDTVVLEGLAVKLEKVGWHNNIYKGIEGLEEAQPADMGYAVFKLTVYNYNVTPYEMKKDDIILKYKDNDSAYEESITNSGYETWNKFNGSFQIDSIPSKTYRLGNIFFPAYPVAKQGGTIRVYMSNVPIDFKY